MWPSRAAGTDVNVKKPNVSLTKRRNVPKRPKKSTSASNLCWCVILVLKHRVNVLSYISRSQWTDIKLISQRWNRLFLSVVLQADQTGFTCSFCFLEAPLTCCCSTSVVLSASGHVVRRLFAVLSIVLSSCNELSEERQRLLTAQRLTLMLPVVPLLSAGCKQPAATQSLYIRAH